MNKSNFNDLMKELRQEYLESFDDKFKQIRTCFDGKDWHGLELEFHKLKGTGSTYGVPEVTQLCEHLERICRRTQNLDELTLNESIDLLKQIRSKYQDNLPFDLESHSAYQKIIAL
jgi:HPt (histidine-containing phosphotransfer) domain-containing protein